MSEFTVERLFMGFRVSDVNAAMKLYGISIDLILAFEQSIETIEGTHHKKYRTYEETPAYCEPMAKAVRLALKDGLLP